MTIKILTVAAAIAVGIATCSLNPVMAACPCNATPCAEALPVVTGPACPCETVKPNTCSKCKKAIPDCECKKKVDPCADPCEKPKKSDCGCNDEISCDKPAEPACASCPQTGKPDRKDMKQVYGYPGAIYGTNNYVGEPANSILSTENVMNGCAAGRMSSGISGTTISRDGAVTGAASQLPCLNEAPTRHNGIPIDRNERLMDGNNCPIDFQSTNSIDAVRKSFVPYEIPNQIMQTTGAAANLGGCQFPDVPNGFWAACDIDKLAINDVVVGYPDG